FVFENVTDGPISTGAGKHYYFTDHGVYVGGAFGVYIPGSYRSDTPMPVVFASHGAYGMGPRELNNWEGVAENHGFIVVAPSYSFATNHYIEGNGAGANIESERHMTAEIMEKLLASDLNIDTTRILATGFSGGGMPTHYMMMKHPRYFTAFCLRSANYSTFYSLDIDLNYWRKKPGYVFWSDNDVSFIPGQGEDFLKDFLKTEDDESWSSAQSDGLIHWTSANGKTEWQENSIGHNHAAELTASWFMELDSADWAIPLDTSNYISINSNELSAVVYPNPVEDLLKVVLSDVVYQKELEIEISSVKGDLMMCDSIIYNGSIHIDMSSFPSGTYFVRLSVEGKQFVNTILKS
ncbi:MAG: T9SS type A sorting domain-containing protein, partial [Bacteroidota bacterium]